MSKPMAVEENDLLSPMCADVSQSEHLFIFWQLKKYYSSTIAPFTNGSVFAGLCVLYLTSKTSD